MRSTDVHSTFHDMWETRPARPHDDRMVGGVASAIARRYAVDPVLVRVAFVVAAFSGVGVPLYVAGWVALPESTADPSVPRPNRPGPFAMVVVGIVALIGLGAMFTDSRNLILPALVVAALLFLLHRSRGSIAAAGPAPAPPQQQGVSFVKQPGAGQMGAGQPVDQVSPPAWDPLGAAPFAWDLPEPAPLAPQPGPRRMPVTAVTLGLALVAAALTWVLLLLTGSLGEGSSSTVLGVALAVIGAGLLVGAFAHAGRGLVPVAVVLGLAAWATITVPFDRVSTGSFGDLDATPIRITDVQPSYDRAAGDLDVDLSGLDLAVPAGAVAQPVETSLNVGAGDIEIRVPRDADVTFHGDSGLGDVEFDDRTSPGPGARMDVDDLGADGIASGRRLVITARVGAGDVELTRG